MLISGARWDDPRWWLDFAYRAADLDPRDAVRFWPSAAYTSRSMAVADLAAFLEALRVFEPIASQGTAEQRLDLAKLHTMIAMVRRGMGDEVAAIGDYRKAAAVAEPIDSDPGRASLVHILDGLSIALRETGATVKAVAADGPGHPGSARVARHARVAPGPRRCPADQSQRPAGRAGEGRPDARGRGRV